MKKLVILFIVLLSLFLGSCSTSKEDTNIKEEKESQVDNGENQQESKEIFIEDANNAGKKLKIVLLKTETSQGYINNNSGEFIRSKGIQIITLQIENIGKEPYNLNSGLANTSGFIQLENDGIKYNNNFYENTIPTLDGLKPGEKSEVKYVFDTNKTELIKGKLIFKKTTIKQEKILNLN